MPFIDEIEKIKEQIINRYHPFKYNEWIKVAQKDLKGAKILYEHDGDYGLVLFHRNKISS